MEQSSKDTYMRERQRYRVTEIEGQRETERFILLVLMSRIEKEVYHLNLCK